MKTLFSSIWPRLSLPHRTDGDDHHVRWLINSMRDAVLMVDPKTTRVVDVNEALEALTGYSRDQLLGKPVVDLCVPEEQATLATAIGMATNEEASKPVTTTWQTRDGDRIPVEVVCGVAMPFDKPVVIVAGRDVTQRVRALEALRSSEQFVHEVIAGAGQGIMVYDRNLCYQVFNPFMERLTGLQAEQVVGRNALEIFPHLHEQGAEALLRQALSGEVVTSRDTRYNVPQTQQTGWVSGTYAPHRDAEGEIIGVVALISDITERKRLEEQLTQQSFTDSLTGLPNRALFFDRLTHALQSIKRRKRLFALLYIDLDRFKVVNDSLGHGVGDDLLVSVGKRLASAIRPSDTFARLGGDEFGVLLEDISDSSEGIRVAERMQHLLQAPFDLNGQELFIRASIGIALNTSDHVQASLLLQHADVALYRAKASGRSQVVVFDTGMNVQAVDQLALETDLRRALERSELVLHYQPVRDLATGAIVAAEALMRWQHSSRGFLPPGEFIPLAEETGMILQIGQWALREACQQALQWQAVGPDDKPFVICVNLSARQFMQPDLAAQILQVLQETGFPPAALELEITESVLMHNAQTTLSVLRVLKDVGLRIAIDDFGTGYSSLSYLRQFPVDTIKIDQSFVSDLDYNTSSVAIVRAILALASSLGLEVTAEGIETESQEHLLRALGCQRGQGYYYSRPVPVAAMTAMLSVAPG